MNHKNTKKQFFSLDINQNGEINGNYKIKDGINEKHMALKLLKKKGFDPELINDAEMMYSYLTKPNDKNNNIFDINTNDDSFTNEEINIGEPKETKEPIVNNEESKEPVINNEESKIPVINNEETKKPIVNNEESKEPVINNEESKEPVVSKEEIVIEKKKRKLNKNIQRQKLRDKNTNTNISK